MALSEEYQILQKYLHHYPSNKENVHNNQLKVKRDELENG